jgi:hypothetical protein
VNSRIILKCILIKERISGCGLDLSFQWWILLNTMLNFRVPWNAGKLVSSCSAITLSRSSLLGFEVLTMSFGEIIAIYPENHRNSSNTVWPESQLISYSLILIRMFAIKTDSQILERYYSVVSYALNIEDLISDFLKLNK